MKKWGKKKVIVAAPGSNQAVVCSAMSVCLLA